MLYFAYGSNLDWDQIKSRCPSSRYICNATLPDYKIAFRSSSRKRNCGVADAMPSPGDIMWGVVYELSESDIFVLDEHEGFDRNRDPDKNSYNREMVTIFRDGDENSPVNAYIYLTVPEEGVHIPNDAYKSHIVNGAKFWNLPADYIRFLENIPTNES
ncbi:MAG TPA: gamma-glutamylcyclotransferase family protein [bacterium]|jgi:gamma-glutamylcyclotransferase (GGCT)/AIG2-like uncharacterized protein YtfP